MTAISAREQILGDIDRALRREGKRERLRGDCSTDVASIPHRDVVSAIREDCDKRRCELIEQFESETTRIGARFQRAPSLEAALQYIADVSSVLEATRIVSWDAQVIDDIGLPAKLEEKGVEFLTETIGPEFIRKTATADIGVSGVDYGLADTGSLVLLARKGQARSVSLLPPVHIAIVRPQQILSGLSDLLPLLRADANAEGRDLSSAITFITGPSRTADIELTLVVGVHGPQQLHVLLLG